MIHHRSKTWKMIVTLKYNNQAIIFGILLQFREWAASATGSTFSCSSAYDSLIVMVSFSDCLTSINVFFVFFLDVPVALSSLCHFWRVRTTCTLNQRSDRHQWRWLYRFRVLQKQTGYSFQIFQNIPFSISFVLHSLQWRTAVPGTGTIL